MDTVIRLKDLDVASDAALDLDSASTSSSTATASSTHEGSSTQHIAHADATPSTSYSGAIQSHITPAQTTDPAASGTSSPCTTVTNDDHDVESGLPRSQLWRFAENKITVSNLLLGCIMVVFTVISWRYLKWTALKDFREDCRAREVQNQSISTDCQGALFGSLAAPPFDKREGFMRSYGRDSPRTNGASMEVDPKHLWYNLEFSSCEDSLYRRNIGDNSGLIASCTLALGLLIAALAA